MNMSYNYLTTERMKPRCKLQWCHLSDETSQITSLITVRSTAGLGYNKTTINICYGVTTMFKWIWDPTYT